MKLIIRILAASAFLIAIAAFTGFITYSTAHAQGVQKPAKPTGLSASTTPGSLDVSVDWDDTSGATSYKVRWREPGKSLNAGITATSSDAVITVADYGDWVVRVEACNSAGCGAPVSQRFTTIVPPPPPIASLETLEIVSTPSTDTDSDGTKDTYGAGAEIQVRFTYDANVTVDTVGGRPYLKIKLHADHSDTKRASYEGGSGTTALTFSYTVVSSDTSKGGNPETDEGIAVLEDSLDMNGGLITSEATGRMVNPTHAGRDHNADHKVDGTLDGRAPRFKSAVVNQTTLIVTFDENFDTSSEPAAGSFCVDTTDPDGAARSFCGVGGSNVSISTGNNALVTVPLSIGVRSDEAVTVSYTVAAASPLQDAAGNNVASFSGRRVTNNSEAPGQPTGVWVSAASLGGSLDVNWTAPDSGETPTGYELRYYQGAGDPPAGREADWKDDVAGLPEPGAAATSATIEGLRANTIYTVQVRAKTAAESGTWSTSASGVTGSPSATNNPPRVLRPKNPLPATGNVCEVVNVNGPIKREINTAATGALVSIGTLVGMSGRTNGWPSECNTGTQSNRINPLFDDVDGDKLTLSIDRRSVPASVRVSPWDDFRVAQPGVLSPTNAGHVFFRGESGFRKVGARAVRARLTATDPHGTSVSVRVYFVISTVANRFGAPSLPEVFDLDASPIWPISLVLPAATGGDSYGESLTLGGAPQHYYAISGLPEGLAFDPETRRISGTPTETGSFSVTYTADDPDTVGSAYLNPETPNTNALNDTASRTFTIDVRPSIALVRVTSAPTLDANGDGRNDTYADGDKITIDVEFTEPVEFDPGTGTTETNTVQLPPLRVGRDDDTSAGTLKTAEFAGTFHGGKTLRFEYTVQSGDSDPDGVFVDSFSGTDADKMLVLKGTATLTGLVSGVAPNLKRTTYVTGNAVDENGVPLSYVNGYLNSAGPKATEAEVDGETLRVTYNEELAALTAAELQSLTFLFGVQGANGTGGDRNAFQHPNSVAMWSGDTDNRTLELTLGVAARAGETITLSYKLNNYKGPIEDTSGNMAPAFVDLVVTNNTGAGGGGAEGAAGAAGAAAESEVTLVSNTGQTLGGGVDFNNDAAQSFTTGSNAPGYKLTKLVVPYGNAAPPASSHTIKIHASNSSNRPGTSLGTLTYGSASGTTVTYNASGTGIALEAGTTYFAVLNTITSAVAGNPEWQRTNSFNEDTGKADGWSIGNVLLHKNTVATTWSTVSTPWQIAIHGTALTPEAVPQPQLARVAGTKLKIVFDEALDDTSSESGKHFKVVFSDRDGNHRTIAGTEADVAISEKTVTVTLAEAVPPNVSAQVTYEPPTLSLKAADENTYVAGFMGFKIETVYDTAVPELMQVAVAQTSKAPYGFRVALYYDEALDTASVPATTDFSFALESNAAVTPNAVAVEDNAVLLTVDLAKAPAEEVYNVTFTEADVSYTKGTNPIRDLAGNEAADVDEDDVAVEAAGTPAVVAATVLGKGDEAKLVGTTGQSHNGTYLFTVERVQAFTTGSNSAGYKLTKLVVPYSAGVPAADKHTISIHASNSNNLPGASLGTLSYGSVSGLNVTYTAPGDGITLDAGTTYVVLLDFKSQGGTGSYTTTDSTAEDAGAADGWTVGDASSFRATHETTWAGHTQSWRIAIHGAALEQVPATVTVTNDPVTLVGNTEQTAGSPGPFSFDYSQAFTTGSNTDGYRLTSVTVPYSTAAPASSSHTISIHPSNTSDRPDASLGTLSYGSVSGQTVTYTASGNGIALDAETTYFVVIDVSGSPSSEINLTSSDAEDAGASDGWSLADGLLWRSSGSSGTWSTFSDTWQIAIQGTAVTKETVTVPATSEATLVGNTGQTLGSGVNFNNDAAQSFSTGSASGGYKLTKLVVPYVNAAPPASSHTIKIHASNSSNRPGTSLGTLTYGSASGTTVTYNASGTGIALEAGTTYFAVLNTITSAVAGNPEWQRTNSFNEDTGKADGWSIGNVLLHKNTVATTWSTVSTPWQIAIHGVINQYTTQFEKIVFEKTANAKVDGASLTVTYDKSLDPTSMPAPDRFTLLDEDGLPVSRVVAVAAAGKKLVLTLNGAVSPCETFTLSYSWSETEKNVRTFTGHEAPDIEAEPVINAQADRCVNGRAVVVQNGEGASGNSGGGSGSQGKQGKSLTLKFDRPLDTGKALKASAFGLAGAAGGAAPAVKGAAYTESGAGVVLTLARALESGETVTLGYTRPAGESGLWNAEGNQIADFSGVAVPVRTSEAPAVTGVEVVSDSGSDDTYAFGETIRVRVTFSEAVEVDTTGGSPRLRIDMDPAAHWGMKWAVYESGGGTESLTFTFEVVQPNESTQGIAVLADTLEANGGAIRSVSGGTDAGLGHYGLDHDPAHKVDWRLAPAGTASVTGVEITSDPGDDDTYALGETIRVRLTFSEAVDVTGTPRLKIKMDPNYGEKWATYESGSGTTVLTFTHEVVQPNESTRGIAVLTNTLEANGGAIRSASAGTDAHLSHTRLGHDPAHKVDWRLTPAVNNAATGTPTITGTARVGETLTADASGIAAADGLDNAVFSYQWVADDADITGATGSTYTLVDSDEDKAVKVRVSFTDDAGNAETLTSEATAGVAPKPNSAASGQPTISGTAQVGETLTAGTSGISDADGLTNAVFSYQWLTGDSDISGATNSTYTLADSDEGKAVKVRVSFTDDAGHDESLISAATAAVAMAVAAENSPAAGAPTITGTARVGETLTAGTSGISDENGLDNATFSYQWLADDADISGATNSTYTLVEADEGKAVKVRVSFTDDAGNDETLTSAATSSVAGRPNSAATGAPTISGTAQVGETLSASISGISDADGLTNAVFSYQWIADDTNISGATGSTYTLVAADEGKAVKVKVSFTDDAGHAETLTSTATTAAAAATPEPTPPAEPPAPPVPLQVEAVASATVLKVGEDLHLSAVVTNAPDGLQPRYRWEVDYGDGTWWEISTAENVVQPNRHTEVATFRVTVTYGQTSASDTVTVEWRHVPAKTVAPKPNSPASGQPTISGTAQVGETLTAATSGISDADGLTNATFSYQWLADDTGISGATGSTYTLIDSDEGKAVKVKVSFTDDAGHTETLSSTATAAVAPKPNSAASGQPTISGTAQVGETLTAGTSGIADADGLTNATFGYQWLADDADISGATNSSYTLVDADEGKTVKVKVSFTDDADHAETLTSSATAAVAAAPPSEPPAKPAGLSMDTESGSLSVSVDWDDVAGAADYLVRWRPHGPGQKLNDGVRTAASAARITVADYGDWLVRVEACNDAGCGPPSTKRFVVEPQPNRAPVVDDRAEQYAGFIGAGNAPRGTLVSKLYDGIFSDPDGDTLTYTVSVPADRSALVDTVYVHEDTRRVFIRMDADGDWGAVTPALATPLVTTVTLTATDPDGLSVSLTGVFHTPWDSAPTQESAQ